MAISWLYFLYLSLLKFSTICIYVLYIKCLHGHIDKNRYNKSTPAPGTCKRGNCLKIKQLPLLLFFKCSQTTTILSISRGAIKAHRSCKLVISHLLQNHPVQWLHLARSSQEIMLKCETPSHKLYQLEYSSRILSS